MHRCYYSLVYLFNVGRGHVAIAKDALQATAFQGRQAQHTLLGPNPFSSPSATLLFLPLLYFLVLSFLLRQEVAAICVVATILWETKCHFTLHYIRGPIDTVSVGSRGHVYESYGPEAVSYTHLTLPTIYSV